MREEMLWRLDQYLQVFRRRWRYLLFFGLVGLAFLLLSFQWPKESYGVGVRFIVSQPPTEGANDSNEQRSFTWITSQYLVNSITDWVNGSEFADQVARELESEGVMVSAEEVYNAIEASTVRSQLTINFLHDDKKELEGILSATTRILRRDNALLPQIGSVLAQFVSIDVPEIKTHSPSKVGWLIGLLMRFFPFFGLGLGVAMLREYMDPRLYDRHHVRYLALPLLASIPKE